MKFRLLTVSNGCKKTENSRPFKYLFYVVVDLQSSWLSWGPTMNKHLLERAERIRET